MLSISTLILSLLLQIIPSVTVIRSFGGNFQSAQCFMVQQNGNSYLIDEKKSLLQNYAANGTVIRAVGGQGLGNYEFNNPTDVSSSFLLDVYVTDFNNKRIQRYDKHLNYIQTYDETTLSAELSGFQPRACALSTQGDLFVIDIDGNRILKLDTRGRLVREFGTFKDGAGMVVEPKDITVSPSDEIFILDKSKILLYDRFGNYLKMLPLSGEGWGNLQASQTALVATSADQILIRYFNSNRQLTITHASITDIAKEEKFVDAVLHNEELVLLTSAGIHFCTIND